MCPQVRCPSCSGAKRRAKQPGRCQMCSGSGRHRYEQVPLALLPLAVCPCGRHPAPCLPCHAWSQSSVNSRCLCAAGGLFLRPGISGQDWTSSSNLWASVRSKVLQEGAGQGEDRPAPAHVRRQEGNVENHPKVRFLTLRIWAWITSNSLHGVSGGGVQEGWVID